MIPSHYYMPLPYASAAISIAIPQEFRKQDVEKQSKVQQDVVAWDDSTGEKQIWEKNVECNKICNGDDAY